MRLAMLSGCLVTLLLSSGWVTKAVWEEGRFARFHEPAIPPNLRLFETADHDILVQYDEWVDTNEKRKMRAYWIGHNEEPKKNPHKPDFVWTANWQELTPIPIYETSSPFLFTNSCLSAVFISQPVGFRLFTGNINVGTYQLPVYPDAAGRAVQILLTPPALTADSIICGGVIGGYCFLTAWASGALGCWH